MVAVPVYRTWSAGEIVTAAFLNSNVRDGGNFWLSSRPRAVLRQTAAQSISNGLGTWVGINFDTEDTDNDGAHSTSTNTNRYVAQTAGTFAFSGAAGWANGTTGGRLTRWAVNGTAVNASQNLATVAFAAAFAMATTTVHIALSAGDYVELQVSQNSGGALNTSATTDTQSRMNVEWLAS